MAETGSILSAFDQIVRSDGGPPGFDGTVAVGLSRPGESLWWWGRFSHNAVLAQISERLPHRPDTALIVDADQAETFLAGGAPPTRNRLIGNPELFSRFWNRYLSRTPMSVLQVRRTTQ